MFPEALLLASLLATLCHAFNVSLITASSPNTPLIAASKHVIDQFFTDVTDRVYIRRLATNRLNVPFQRDVISSILQQVEPAIAVQVENVRAKALNQSRAFNVFLVDDYEAFGLLSDRMNVQKYDYAGYFLVIVTNSSESSYRTVQQIMNDLWSHYIVNVAVLLAYDSQPGKAFYYTYFPFGEGYCEQVRPLLWKVFSDGLFDHKEKEFYPQKMKNFYGCPLKLATFNIPPFMMLEYGFDGRVVRTNGLDGIVAQVLSQMLNFTMKVIVVDPPEWGDTGPHDYTTGASRYIQNRLANFTIGYWSTTHNRNRYMGNTLAYYTSLMTLAVPPGQPYDSLEQLMLPFEGATWSVIGTILLVAIVVIIIIKHHPRNVQRFVFGQTSTDPLLNTFSISFGGALQRSPARNFSRTLLALWLLYGIVIRTSYSGALYKFLQKQPNKTVPALVSEYVSAGYRIHMVHNFSYIFDAFPDFGNSLKLTSLTEFFSTEIDELQLPATHYVVLLPLEAIAFQNRFLTKEGRVLRTCWDRVYLSKLTIYSQRSSPILDPFNFVLGSLHTAGLIDHWASRYLQTVFLKTSTTMDDPKRFTVGQLSGCLKLLLVGQGVSLVVFIGECIVGRWQKQRQSRRLQ